MPLDTDIVAYLDPLISETAGTDLFEGPMPELPDNCVAVTHYNSQASDDFSMTPSLTAPASELEDFQVMVRNTVKATAESKAAAIHALLDNAQNLTINGRTYFTITSDGPPSAILGQDSNLRWRRSANYHARKIRG